MSRLCPDDELAGRGRQQPEYGEQHDDGNESRGEVRFEFFHGEAALGGVDVCGFVRRGVAPQGILSPRLRLADTACNALTLAPGPGRLLESVSKHK